MIELDPIIVLSKFYPWIINYSFEKGLDPDNPRYLTKLHKHSNLNNIDIAVIGAGSAGSIIVNKLLSETNFNIALIEAGPKDNNPVIVPLGYGMTFYNKKINWNFYSENKQFI